MQHLTERRLIGSVTASYYVTIAGNYDVVIRSQVVEEEVIKLETRKIEYGSAFLGFPGARRLGMESYAHHGDSKLRL
ncbi:hypothetical protein AGOR_G00064090 [Albula goreensis]|uniref:Uncharacterized protein n=1 Tax=Albula goreensis TaxID=1534307 RepID=A0A8T3DSC1_9TELE|nr:hypothetical protein AGOR_G00064090 [Albula goreensis]